MNIIKVLKSFSHSLNQKGVPVPTIRDPKTGAGSVSLTMLVVSFGVAVIGLIGKISKFLGDVDMTQALWLLGISSSLYFGRRLGGDGKGKVEIGEKVE